MNKSKESQAQLEVWEWKDAAWAEVAHLPLREAFCERCRIATETVRRIGLPPTQVESGKSLSTAASVLRDAKSAEK